MDHQNHACVSCKWTVKIGISRLWIFAQKLVVFKAKLHTPEYSFWFGSCFFIPNGLLYVYVNVSSLTQEITNTLQNNYLF